MLDSTRTVEIFFSQELRYGGAVFDIFVSINRSILDYDIVIFMCDFCDYFAEKIYFLYMIEFLVL